MKTISIKPAVLLSVLLFAGCATPGLTVIQNPGSGLGKYTTAGIKVVNNAASNKLAVSVDKKYKTKDIIEVERLMVRTMLADRLLRDKRFDKLYNYENNQAGAQLFIDVTIRAFDYNENDYKYLGTVSVYHKGFKLGDIGITNTDQTARLLINAVLYNGADMRRIAEVDLTVDKERLDGTHAEFGEGKPFANYQEYLVSRALDALMAFMESKK